MKTVSTLIEEIGMTIIDSRELEHGITQYTLNNGCIVCRTQEGHIYLQGKNRESVAGLFAREMPLESLKKADAKKFRRELYLKAFETLVGKDTISATIK